MLTDRSPSTPGSNGGIHYCWRWCQNLLCKKRDLGQRYWWRLAALDLEPLLLDDLSANRRVVFYDPRNRGRSDSADLSSLSLDRQIEDLEELRRELGLEKMMLLGWSSYGLEMAVYAMRYPERVTHLVQISPLAPASALLEQFSDTHDQRTDRLAIEALDRRSDAGDFDDSPEEYCRLRNALTIPPDFVNTDLAKQAPDDCKYPNEWPKNRSPYFRAFFATFGDFDWRNDLNGLKIPRIDNPRSRGPRAA